MIIVLLLTNKLERSNFSLNVAVPTPSKYSEYSKDIQSIATTMAGLEYHREHPRVTRCRDYLRVPLSTVCAVSLLAICRISWHLSLLS